MITYRDYSIKSIAPQYFSQVVLLDRITNPSSVWTEIEYQKATEAKRVLLLGCFNAEELIAMLSYVVIIDIVEIHNVATKPQYTKQGIATRLITHMISEIKKEGIAHTILLETRASNNTAQRIYERIGFKPYTERKDYYSNPKEDAILFQYSIKKPY